MTFLSENALNRVVTCVWANTWPLLVIGTISLLLFGCFSRRLE
jgi:hypothetical protein